MRLLLAVLLHVATVAIVRPALASAPQTLRDERSCLMESTRVYAAQAYEYPKISDAPEMTDWGEEMPRGDAINGMGSFLGGLGTERCV